jgi:hypothetical protein
LDYRIHGESSSTSGARLARSKVRWLRECMVRRRAGKPEPGWEAFLADYNSLPFLARLNYERKDLAKVLYKSAVSHYAHRQYVALAVKLAAAALLQPTYTIHQVITKHTIGCDPGFL